MREVIGMYAEGFSQPKMDAIKSNKIYHEFQKYSLNNPNPKEHKDSKQPKLRPSSPLRHLHVHIFWYVPLNLPSENLI